MASLEQVLSNTLTVLQFIGTAVEILWGFLPIFLIIFLILGVMGYYEDLNFKRVKQSKIVEIDYLSPGKFKYFIRTLLFMLGYKEVTPELQEEDSEEEEEDNKTGEENLLEKIRKEQESKKKKESKRLKVLDAVVVRGGTYIGVLAVKDLKTNIDPVLEKLASAMNDYNCNEGLLITNARLSASRLQEATSRNIVVWDREKLIQKLFQLQGRTDPKKKSLFFYLSDFWSWVFRG